MQTDGNQGLYRQTIRLIAGIAFCCFVSAVQGRELSDVFNDTTAEWLHWDSPSEDPAKEDDEPLETDRDSFTFAATTVGTGKTLVEMSYSFLENRSVPNTNSFPEMLTRVGLTERLELRLGWNYEVGGGGYVSGADLGESQEEPGINRESQITYGFKYALTRQKSWLPESACIVQLVTPTSGPAKSTQVIAGYVFGWTFLDNWKLDSAIRYATEAEGSDHYNEWAPSVVLKVPVQKRWNVHGEYFGIFTDGRTNNSNPQYLSPGISFLISKDCEIGVRCGWGLNQDAASFFNNVGLGWRF